MVRGHHTVINMQVLTCKHSLPHLGNSHSRWITHLYTKCLFLLCSVFFFSTSILLASITSLSARGLCTDPISPHNSVAFIPCCTSFTTDSVLLGICFYTACLYCALSCDCELERNIWSIALQRLPLRWCSLFPVGLSVPALNLPISACCPA